MVELALVAMLVISLLVSLLLTLLAVSVVELVFSVAEWLGCLTFFVEVKLLI